MIRITVVSLATISVFTGYMATCPQCPFQWLKHQGHCYRYFPTPLSYHDAEKYCQCRAISGRVSSLAKISSPTEVLFLARYIRSILNATTTLDTAAGFVQLGRQPNSMFENYNMVYHNTLGENTEPISHSTSCDTHNPSVTILKGNGISRMVPSPKVVEHKCSTYAGEGAFIDLGDFAGTCVSDPDACTSASVTWSLWLKINSSASLNPDRYYLSVGGQTYRGRGVVLVQQIQHGHFLFAARHIRKGNSQRYSPSQIPMDRWFHLAATVSLTLNGTWVVVYLDGRELTPTSSGEPPSSPNDRCTRLLLGNMNPCDGNPPASSKRFGGTAAYSNLMVFDHLLSQEQISNLYACGSLDWDLKVRDLYIDDTYKNMGSLRYVCTASTSTGPAIHWSVYLREEAQRLDLGNSTAGCFEISLTSFSQCVIQSTLTIDQNCGLVGEDDIITCTANSGSVNVSQHIHQGMTITNSGLAYFKDFTINENIKNDNHPFICKMVDPRF